MLTKIRLTLYDIEQAYKKDPRIQRFKQQDLEQKIAKKSAREEAVRQAELESKKVMIYKVLTDFENIATRRTREVSAETSRRRKIQGILFNLDVFNNP